MRTPFALALSLAVFPAALWTPGTAFAQSDPVASAAAEPNGAPSPVAAVPSTSAPAISVATVLRHALTDRVRASGLVAAVEEVAVQPLIEGQPVDALLVDVGDAVAAGQVLARLSTSTLDLQVLELAASAASAAAAVAQAEAQLEEARSAAEEAARVDARTRTLGEKGAASQASVDAAESNAVSAQARVRAATQSLNAARAQVDLVAAQRAAVDLQRARTEVVSPVAGVVLARNARVGGVASASGEAMFVVARDGAWELRAELAERDVRRVAVGQRVAMAPVDGGATLEGAVRLVEPRIDAVTRLGQARVAIEDADAVRPGMFLDSEIVVVERTAVAVPVSALDSADGLSSVMRVRGDRVERVAVVAGIRDGALVEIVEGLAAGDVVVLKAGAFVRDGARINPVMDAPTLEATTPSPTTAGPAVSTTPASEEGAAP